MHFSLWIPNCPSAVYEEAEAASVLRGARFLINQAHTRVAALCPLSSPIRLFAGQGSATLS